MDIEKQPITATQLQTIKEHLQKGYSGLSPEYRYDSMHNDIWCLLHHTEALEVALGTQKAVMRVAKEALETVIDHAADEGWSLMFIDDCREAFNALDAALGFEG